MKWIHLRDQFWRPGKSTPLKTWLDSMFTAFLATSFLGWSMGLVFNLRIESALALALATCSIAIGLVAVWRDDVGLWHTICHPLRRWELSIQADELKAKRELTERFELARLEKERAERDWEIELKRIERLAALTKIYEREEIETSDEANERK